MFDFELPAGQTIQWIEKPHLLTADVLQLQTVTTDVTARVSWWLGGQERSGV